MPLLPGTRLGTYEILALLGKGAMGEVYRARDARLGRDVAIKVLPAELTANADRLARFEREARVLAAVNHPNIATIHGIEDSPGVRALVMELVEGETLAERIGQSKRGSSSRLSPAAALGIARQIGAALEAAHEKGIVHRDLKPDNVILMPSGTLKVLDFGIAKFRDESNAGSHAATTVVGETRLGAVLGTAAYMSPEQARGLPVDKRTDVWAFGCVLYELLTGCAAFQGPTVTDTLAAVLEREPDWDRLPAAVPPAILRLLQRCLQKDSHQRLRDIGDIRIQLEDALAGPEPGAAASHAGTPGRRSAYMVWGAAALVLLAVGGFVAAPYFASPAPPAASAPVTRLSISTPWPVIPPTGVAVSPDGLRVAFVAADESGQARLVVRALDSVDIRALPGTEYARHPFWSPDGRSIGFWANGQVKRADVAGGSVLTVAEAANGGGTWSKDDIILFRRETGLWAVPAGGGTPVEVTIFASADELGHDWPHFLPDGRRFLYFVRSVDPAHQGVHVGSLDSRDTRLVLNTDFQARYAAPGHLLFMRDEQLLAQPFDLERLELTGQPAIVADGVWVAALAGRATFSASDSGTLAYISAALWNTQLAWFDRRGALLGELGPPDRYAGQLPDLSPDGRRVVIARGLWSREQVWMLDANDGAATRLTFGDGRTWAPVWSGDGERVMYESWTADEQRIAIKNVDSSEEETVAGLNGVRLLDWSTDGRFAVYRESPSNDLWALPLDGDRTPIALTESPGAQETQAQISPDSRWLAYVSNESGRDEVYVQRFPDGGGKRQVSPAGGAAPRWRPDGTELFYIAPDSYLMAVDVRGTASLELGSPTQLFRRTTYLDASNASVGGVLDVSADGQRFLINVRADELTAPIMIVGNWPAALRR
jgi:Tol biopolymer transport system component